jgi:hypothetical protein
MVSLDLSESRVDCFITVAERLCYVEWTWVEILPLTLTLSPRVLVERGRIDGES